MSGLLQICAAWYGRRHLWEAIGLNPWSPSLTAEGAIAGPPSWADSALPKAAGDSEPAAALRLPKRMQYQCCTSDEAEERCPGCERWVCTERCWAGDHLGSCWNCVPQF